MKAHQLLPLIFLCLSWCQNSCTSSNPDEFLIFETRKQSNQAIAAKDTAALAKFWTEDFHVITSRNSEASGRLKNQIAFVKEFEAGKIFIRTPKKIEVFSDWKMASEHGEWIGKWNATDGPVEISGTYFAKWHKINKQWLIRSEIFVPLRCKGEPFCGNAPF